MVCDEHCTHTDESASIAVDFVLLLFVLAQLPDMQRDTDFTCKHPETATEAVVEWI